MPAFFCAANNNKDTLVFAGIRYRRQGEDHWSKGNFAKLEPEHDMCEVFARTTCPPTMSIRPGSGPAGPAHTVDTVKELPLQWPRQVYHLRTRSSQAGRWAGSYCRLLPISAHDRRYTIRPSLAGQNLRFNFTLGGADSLSRQRAG